MGKIKVYELAKELEISSKETIEKLLKVGIEVKSHLSVIETEDADKIRKSSGNESKKHDTKIVKAQRHEAKAGETGASIPKKDSKPEVRPVHKTADKTGKADAAQREDRTSKGGAVNERNDNQLEIGRASCRERV